MELTALRSCSLTVLDTSIGGGKTCRSQIESFKASVDELNACYFTAYYFPSQCAACHSFAAPCNVFVPASSPTTSAPVAGTTGTLTFAKGLARSPALTPALYTVLSASPVSLPTVSSPSLPTVSQQPVVPTHAPSPLPVKLPTVATPTDAPSNRPIKLPTVTMPLTSRSCAKSVKRSCGCSGTTKCKKQAVKLSCNAPKALVQLKVYYSAVFAKLKAVC